MIGNGAAHRNDVPAKSLFAAPSPFLAGEGPGAGRKRIKAIY
jgi:alkyl hydroperoxide reductase subunit AhpF